MSRTVSARIPNETHEELRERCNKVGCTMNEWLEHAIEFCMTDHTNFDFGGDEDDPAYPEKQTSGSSYDRKESSSEVVRPVAVGSDLVQPLPRAEAKITRVSYDDGKTWYDMKGNEIKKEIPKVTLWV